MNRIIASAVAAVALLSAACAVNTGADASNTTPAPSPDDKISCLWKAHNTMTCTALNPSDTISYKCWSDVRRGDCKDSFDSDYGGGCVFTHDYSATPLTTDCDTFQAENPELFEK